MFLRLLRLISPYKGWIALAVLLGSATVASGISLMATSAYLLAAAALHPSVAELEVAIVGVRFFGIARGVFRYLERYVSHTVTLRLLGRWRVWFYQTLEPLAPARLYQFRSGDLLARTVGDIETLQDFYVRVIAPPVVAIVVAGGMTLWLWGFDPALAVVLLGSWLIAGVGLPAFAGRLASKSAQRMIATRAALHARLVDGIQGMADLVAYGQEKQVTHAVESTGQNYAAAQTRLAWTTALQSGLGVLLTNLTMLVILALAIGLVNAGRMNG
ncbi:MAG: ABC transporter transmembrane domain-containing protein, partial [Anaerolineae bacterium]